MWVDLGVLLNFLLFDILCFIILFCLDCGKVLKCVRLWSYCCIEVKLDFLRFVVLLLIKVV